jgi:hypothetical protein
MEWRPLLIITIIFNYLAGLKKIRINLGNYSTAFSLPQALDYTAIHHTAHLCQSWPRILSLMDCRT